MVGKTISESSRSTAQLSYIIFAVVVAVVVGGASRALYGGYVVALSLFGCQCLFNISLLTSRRVSMGMCV